MNRETRIKLLRQYESGYRVYMVYWGPEIEDSRPPGIYFVVYETPPNDHFPNGITNIEQYTFRDIIQVRRKDYYKRYRKKNIASYQAVNPEKTIEALCDYALTPPKELPRGYWKNFVNEMNANQKAPG